MEDRVGDREEVDIEGAEAKGLQRKSDISGRRGLWNIGDESDGVQWP